MYENSLIELIDAADSATSTMIGVARIMSAFAIEAEADDDRPDACQLLEQYLDDEAVRLRSARDVALRAHMESRLP